MGVTLFSYHSHFLIVSSFCQLGIKLIEYDSYHHCLVGSVGKLSNNALLSTLLTSHSEAQIATIAEKEGAPLSGASVGVERNRNQETGSFQELLELVISGKCVHSRYPHKTPGIKNSYKIARSCSTPRLLFID